ALSHIESRLPRPWLHIAAVSAAHAKERGFRCIGITGTRQMVESDIYPTKLTEVGLRYVRPNASERAAIDRIIFEELVRGVFTVESLQYLQNVIAGLKDQGCDAVVLGCTEIPLLLNDANSPLPTI